LNLGVVKPGDFELRTRGGYRLTGEAMGRLAETFEKELAASAAAGVALKDIIEARVRALLPNGRRGLAN